MLSLPLIPPRPDASLWPSHAVNNGYADGPSADPNSPPNNGHRRPGSHHGHRAHHGHHDHHHQNGHHGHSHQTSSRSYLATLAADENVLHQRKQNVRRFGAGWIRPPGVAKTYQAMMDEAAEREEQELLARREQVLLDLAAAQANANNRQAAAEGQDEEMMEGERDLDDEVPEADQTQLSDSTDESEVEEGDTSLAEGQADMTFNEDSFIEGSMVAAEVEHMLEREEAEIAGVLQDERDLDDDVPEAGSYEHTDTELDSSSDEGDNSRLSVPSTRRRRSTRRSSGLPSARSARSARSTRSTRSAAGPSAAGPSAPGPRDSMNFDNRHSFGLDGSSSILDGSSFLRSSPAAARGSLRSRFMGARAQRGG